jgi:PKD repeat protein
MIEGNDWSIAVNDSVLFVDQSGPPGIDLQAWKWDFEGGDTNTSSLQIPPKITYYTVGTFNVKLTVTNQGENADETKIIDVGNPPEAGFYVLDSVIEQGGTVFFTDTSLYFPTSREWYVDDSLVSVDQNPTITFDETGEKAIKLVVENDYGSNEKVESDFITVWSRPEASFSLDEYYTINIPITIDNLSPGTAWPDPSYNWTITKDGVPFLNSNSDDINYTFPEEGIYEVKLIAKHKYAKDSMVKSTNILAPLTVSITATPPKVCPDSSIILIANASNSVNLQYDWWDFPPVSDSSEISQANDTINLKPEPGHFYKVKVSSTETKQEGWGVIDALLYPLPDATIVTKPKDTANPVLIICTNPGQEYQWYGPQGYDALIGETKQFYYPENGFQEGFYYVEVTDSSSRCVNVSDSIEIIPIIEEKLTIAPNPNNGSFVVYLPYNLQENETRTLYVWSAAGVLIDQLDLAGTSGDVSYSLPDNSKAGVYLLELRPESGKSIISKLIIK